MSKEYLEAFGRITLHTEYDNDGSYDCLQFEDDCKLVDEALKRLESIDNANPSEALECLERIEADLVGLPKHVTEYDDIFDSYLEDIWDSIDTIKQALLKAQEHNSVNLLMQELDCKDFADLRKYARCGYEK